MQGEQQWIVFFWPLTEQMPLDLDFGPCEEYLRKKKEEEQRKYAGITVANLGEYGVTTCANPVTSTLTILPQDSVGYWSFDNGSVQLGLKKRPNLLTRILTKMYFEWDWKDK